MVASTPLDELIVIPRLQELCQKSKNAGNSADAAGGSLRHSADDVK